MPPLSNLRSRPLSSPESLGSLEPSTCRKLNAEAVGNSLPSTPDRTLRSAAEARQLLAVCLGGSDSRAHGLGQRFSSSPSIYGRVIPPMPTHPVSGPEQPHQSVRAPCFSVGLATSNPFVPSPPAPIPASFSVLPLILFDSFTPYRPSAHRVHSNTTIKKHWYVHSNFMGYYTNVGVTI